MAIITENDWKLFCEDWGGTEERGISAVIEINKCMEDSAVGFSEDMPMSEEHMDSDITIDEAEGKCPMIKTSPEVMNLNVFL